MSVALCRVALTPEVTYDVPNNILPPGFGNLPPAQQAEQMASILDALPIVSWGLSHYQDLQPALADFQAIVGTGTPAQKIAAVQSLLALLQKDFADFPGFGSSSPTPAPTPTPTPTPGPIGPVSHQKMLATVHGQMDAIGDGHILDNFINTLNSPGFQAILSLLITVLK